MTYIVRFDRTYNLLFLNKFANILYNIEIALTVMLHTKKNYNN